MNRQQENHKRGTELILASASPRRREILDQAGYDFRVEVSHADENVSEANPMVLVEELAARKGQAVTANYLGPDKAQSKSYLIISADTIVVHEGEILGKPMDQEDAFAMLKKLSGQIHQVVTGVGLSLVSEGRLIRSDLFHEVTDVHFRELTDQEIRDYIASGDPMDKAGAYGIQGMAGMFVSGIRGDYYNVVGLPLCATVVHLRKILEG